VEGLEFVRNASASECGGEEERRGLGFFNNWY